LAKEVAKLSVQDKDKNQEGLVITDTIAHPASSRTNINTPSHVEGRQDQPSSNNNTIQDDNNKEAMSQMPHDAPPL
jgi:hypothetical protein